MLKSLTLSILLLSTSVLYGDLPDLGGIYFGITQTATKSNFPETKDDLLPGSELSRSYLLINTALEVRLRGLLVVLGSDARNWDLTAVLSYAKDEQIENILLSSGLLGHFLYGRNYYHSDRVRAGVDSW